MKVVIGVKDVMSSDGENKLFDVAKWNEYGYDKTPSRPAFRRGGRAAIRLNKQNTEDYLLNIWKVANSDETDKIGEIKKLKGELLRKLGVKAVSVTKQIIKQGREKPNAAYTIKKKGFDHPLYEHGTLLDNVSYQVRNGEPKNIEKKKGSNK